jgi:hypothetical protein
MEFYFLKGEYEVLERESRGAEGFCGAYVRGTKCGWFLKNGGEILFFFGVNG